MYQAKKYKMIRVTVAGEWGLMACTGFKLLTYAIPVQRSIQLSKQANWELVIIKIDHSLALNLLQK